MRRAYPTLTFFPPFFLEVYYSVEEVLFMLENTVFGVMEKYSVSKVSMVVHDMGCVFGYHFAFLHPSKVDSFISFDIGATVKCTKKDLEAERTKSAFDKSALYQFKSFKGGKGRLNMAKMMFYQWSFCLFYLLGTKVSYDISNLLLQNFVRVLNWTSFIQKREHKHTSGRSASDIRCFILYPYLAVWSKVFGKDKSLMRNYTYVSKHMDAAGSDGKRPETYSGNLPVFLPLSDEVKCLFMYGSEKTLTFHTESFLQELKSRPGCASMGVEGGHWFYWDKPDLVAKVVRDFLSGIVYNYADSPRLKPSRL